MDIPPAYAYSPDLPRAAAAVVAMLAMDMVTAVPMPAMDVVTTVPPTTMKTATAPTTMLRHRLTAQTTTSRPIRPHVLVHQTPRVPTHTPTSAHPRRPSPPTSVTDGASTPGVTGSVTGDLPSQRTRAAIDLTDRRLSSFIDPNLAAHMRVGDVPGRSTPYGPDADAY